MDKAIVDSVTKAFKEMSREQIKEIIFDPYFHIGE